MATRNPMHTAAMARTIELDDVVTGTFGAAGPQKACAARPMTSATPAALSAYTAPCKLSVARSLEAPIHVVSSAAPPRTRTSAVPVAIALLPTIVNTSASVLKKMKFARAPTRLSMIENTTA